MKLFMGLLLLCLVISDCSDLPNLKVSIANGDIEGIRSIFYGKEVDVPWESVLKATGIKIMKLFVGLLCLVISDCSDLPNPKVSIANGDIEGIRSIFFGREVDVFSGIPYAQAPVGNLRFKMPVPMKPWGSILKADKISDECLQPTNFPPQSKEQDTPIVGSEDCLYLNVYSPVIGESSENTNGTAVMLFIHGGGFTIGSSKKYEAGNLAALGEVVVVTINYRLSIFGFSVLDPNGSESANQIPPNLGLFDQQMALKWTYDNIYNFGGDPEKITIFGESAGSGGISAQLTNQESRGYFNSAIMQSGSHLCRFSPSTRAFAVETTKKTAELAGCATDDHLFECLKSVDAIKLAGALATYAKAIGNFFPLLWVTDEDGFFNGDAIEEFENADFSARSIMVGMTGDESTLFLLSDCPLIFQTRDNTTKEQYEQCINNKLRNHTDEQRNLMLQHYAPPAYPNYFESTNKLYDDLDEGCCAVHDVAKIVEKSALNTFVFVFDYIANFSSSYPGILEMGAYHSSELPFIFGHILDYTDVVEDTEVSRRMMKYWSNFAKFGQPEMQDTKLWPGNSFSKKEGDKSPSITYKIIEATDTESSVKHDFLQENCAFLKENEIY